MNSIQFNASHYDNSLHFLEKIAFVADIKSRTGAHDNLSQRPKQNLYLSFVFSGSQFSSLVLCLFFVTGLVGIVRRHILFVSVCCDRVAIVWFLLGGRFIAQKKKQPANNKAILLHISTSLSSMAIKKSFSSRKSSFWQPNMHGFWQLKQTNTHHFRAGFWLTL